MKCVNQDGSLCITSCHTRRDTLLETGAETRLSCRLSNLVKYSDGIVEGRGFNPDHILVAHSLNCVSKGQTVVVHRLKTSAALVLVKAGMIVAQFQPCKQVQAYEMPI